MWHSLAVMIDKNVDSHTILVIYDTDSDVKSKRSVRWKSFIARTSMNLFIEKMKLYHIIPQNTTYFWINGTDHAGEDECNWYTFEWMCDMVVNPINFREKPTPNNYIKAIK